MKMIKIKIALGIFSIFIGAVGLFIPTVSVDSALLVSVIFIGIGIATVYARKKYCWIYLLFAVSSAIGAYSSIDIMPTLYTVIAYAIVVAYVIIFYIELSSPQETPKKEEE